VDEPDHVIVKSATKTIAKCFNIGADYFYRYRLLPIVLIIGPITRMTV